MTPKFKFNQRVHVASGFYSGYDASLDGYTIKEEIIPSPSTLYIAPPRKYVEYKVSLVKKGTNYFYGPVGQVSIRESDLVEIPEKG